MDRRLIVAFCIVFFLGIMPAAHSAGNQSLWNNLTKGARETIISSYLAGHFDGANTFGYLYRKLVGSPLTREQGVQLEKYVLVTPDSYFKTASYLDSFLTQAYSSNKYSSVGMYVMMSYGVICSSQGLTHGECLDLFGPMMLEK